MSSRPYTNPHANTNTNVSTPQHVVLDAVLSDLHNPNNLTNPNNPKLKSMGKSVRQRQMNRQSETDAFLMAEQER